MKHKPDRHSDTLRRWLSQRSAPRRRKLGKVLESKGLADQSLAHLLSRGDLAGLRKEIVTELEIG